MRSRIWGIDVQIIPGNHVQMIPKLLLVVFLHVHLRVQGLHHPYNRTGLLAALVPVGNRLYLLDHIQYDAAIFRHLKFLPLCVVVEFY